MAKASIKIGTEVVVIAGSEKEKSGVITSINRKNDTVTVEGVNLRKKAVKPSGENEGGIVEFEGPLHISNVMPKERYDSRKAAKA
ncbi:MAG: 50S ribosomal protein L24 [Lentisphaerales bacterium]|nr:50S ribosomal protein L24 [Lentisphaerales bacterium]